MPTGIIQNEDAAFGCARCRLAGERIKQSLKCLCLAVLEDGAYELTRGRANVILHAYMRRKLGRTHPSTLKFIQQRLPPLSRNSDIPAPVHFQLLALVGIRHGSTMPTFYSSG